MYRHTTLICCLTALLLMLTAAPAGAGTLTQQAQVQAYAVGGGVQRAGRPVLLDAYLATRDPAGKSVWRQPQAVATVRMQFPPGSRVQPIGRCPLWPTSRPWDFQRLCARDRVGEGWALVAGLGSSPLPRLETRSGSTTAPTGVGNYQDAPPDCAAEDAAQYARSYARTVTWKRPLDGLACTPRGYTWVHVAAYAGSGNGAVNPATGAVYDRTDPARTRPPRVTNRTAVVFANDNGVAALSFAGSITPNRAGTLLAVDLPAFNSAGLKGFLPLDTSLVDFHLVINNPRYLTAGACPRSRRVAVSTILTYSPFPADFASDPLTPVEPPQRIVSSASCRP